MNELLDPALEVKPAEQLGRSPPTSPGAGSPICGIYGIWCEADEKWYVGQSTDISDRWDRHVRSLSRGHHVNRYMQAAWNKHGGHQFLFVLLFVAPSGDLNLLEVLWISTLQALIPAGFNLKHGGDRHALLPESLARIRVAREAKYLARRRAEGASAGSKKCTKCQVLKELPEFPKDKKMLDGRESECRSCASRRRNPDALTRQERYNLRRAAEGAAIGSKRCTRCGLIKKLDAYPEIVGPLDRHGSWCQECTKIFQHELRIRRRAAQAT